MNPFQAILDAIVALLKAVPYFDKWFSKSTEQKVEEGAADIEARIKKEQESGRP